MNAGLMDKEEMDKLGMIEETSWKSEDEEKLYLYQKINDLK
jgi:cytochrome c oxidase assembly protein subunit 19